MSINSYSNNVYSQSGEDGIIGRLLSLISEKSQLSNWCVEFGAWDGKFLSNTFHLLENKNFNAVYIESDPKKFRLLVSNMKSYTVNCINTFVDISNNKLDYILRNTLIPTEFDVLSIDIDGCDYYIFESLQIYRPKIILIEYNPTIPNDVYFVQEPDFNLSYGASALAIQQLANNKNYTVVAVTATNIILVDHKYIQDDWQLNSDLSILRPDNALKISMFFGYDGTVLFSTNKIYYPWLGLHLSPHDFQFFPKYLRTQNISFFKKFIMIIYLFIFKRHVLKADHLRMGASWFFSKY